MVGYAFLLLQGWVECVGAVRTGGRFGESAGARVGGGGWGFGVEYGWGVILSSS